MTQILLGMLGFAHYHAQYWIDAWQADPRVSLAGAWDDDPARARAEGERHGLPVYDHLPALLAAVDAVGICSTTARHAELILAACGAGRHVLCEKPVTTTLDDLARVERAVAASGVTFVQSFPKRLDPANAELRALMASGCLGDIWLARVRHGHGHGRDPAFLAGWWTDPGESGGGTLIDEGVHATDLLRWLFGDPESVQATLGQALPGLRVESSAVAVFRWSGGLIGEVVTGWMFAAAETSVELYGTKGTAILSGVDLASRAAAPPFLRVSLLGQEGWQGSPIEPAFVQGRFHQRSADAFIDALANGTAPPAGLDEAGGALRMVLAGYRSAAEGRSVRLEELTSGQRPCDPGM